MIAENVTCDNSNKIVKLDDWPSPPPLLGRHKCKTQKRVLQGMKSNHLIGTLAPGRPAVRGFGPWWLRGMVSAAELAGEMGYANANDFTGRSGSLDLVPGTAHDMAAREDFEPLHHIKSLLNHIGVIRLWSEAFGRSRKPSNVGGTDSY